MTVQTGVYLFAGRCQLATGAAAQGVSGDVRYSGVLSCMSDPEVAALRIENVVPNRLLPSATYIAPANPVWWASPWSTHCGVCSPTRAPPLER